MSQPTVTVAICYLNGDNFLREAVDSIRSQTLQDWELVLINDGSTDGSGAFGRDLAAKDPRIKYAEHPGGANRGLGASRVLALQEASGRYLLYLDHDDILYPHALSRMVEILDQAPAADALFATVLFWAFDSALGLKDYTQVFDPLPNGVTNGRAFLRRMLRSDDMHPATCSTLYRREALSAARGAGEPYTGMYEDTAILAQILNRGDVYLLNEPVSAYRMHGGSMCQTAEASGSHNNEGDSLDRLAFLRWLRGNLSTDVPTRLRIELEIACYDYPALLAAYRKLRRGLRSDRQ